MASESSCLPSHLTVEVYDPLDGWIYARWSTRYRPGSPKAATILALPRAMRDANLRRADGRPSGGRLPRTRTRLTTKEAGNGD